MSTEPGRDESWAAVWNERDESRADWNGCEACFESQEDYLAWVRSVAEMVTVELDLGPTDDVLDLGCGSGRVAAIIGPRVHSLLGLDFSRPALAVAAKERSAANVRFEWEDLNDYDPSHFDNRSKAYAVGSMFYLKSTDHVMDLAAELNRRGTDVLLVDLPDAELEEGRGRDYDRQTYSHLQFRESDFLAAFPGSRIIRGRFPEYVNDASRFTVMIPGQ